MFCTHQYFRNRNSLSKLWIVDPRQRRNSTLSSCLIGVYKLLKKHCHNEHIIPATISFSNTIGRDFKNDYTLPCTRFKYGNFRSFRMISTKYWLAMPCYAFLCYTQNSTSCYASQHPNWSESKTHYVITHIMWSTYKNSHLYVIRHVIKSDIRGQFHERQGNFLGPKTNSVNIQTCWIGISVASPQTSQFCFVNW